MMRIFNSAFPSSSSSSSSRIGMVVSGHLGPSAGRCAPKSFHASDTPPPCIVEPHALLAARVGHAPCTLLAIVLHAASAAASDPLVINVVVADVVVVVVVVVSSPRKC